jgi:hypothetical protein
LTPTARPPHAQMVENRPFTPGHRRLFKVSGKSTPLGKPAALRTENCGGRAIGVRLDSALQVICEVTHTRRDERYFCNWRPRGTRRAPLGRAPPRVHKPGGCRFGVGTTELHKRQITHSFRGTKEERNQCSGFEGHTPAPYRPPTLRDAFTGVGYKRRCHSANI